MTILELKLGFQIEIQISKDMSHLEAAESLWSTKKSRREMYAVGV